MKRHSVGGKQRMETQRIERGDSEVIAFSSIRRVGWPLAGRRAMRRYLEQRSGRLKTDGGNAAPRSRESGNGVELADVRLKKALDAT